MFPILPMSKVAIDFFAMFARMEYALKRIEAYRSRDGQADEDGNVRVKANWSAFAETLAIKALFEKLRDDPKAGKLVALPPKQRLFGEALPWGAQPPPCVDMPGVCRAMRNARNNLVHGEKGRVELPREKELLEAGICIMDAMLEADSEVAASYLS